MRAAAAALAAAVLASSAAHADVLSGKPDAVTVAIYHQTSIDTQQMIREGGSWGTFAFVTETRSVDLPAGPSVIRFRGVASTMVPESAGLEGLPDGALERNFDYDLLSPGSLLARSVGRNVHLVRTNPATGRETEESATVRAASGGAVLEVGGRIEALHCGGPPERLVFDDVPEGLTDKPTFSVRAVLPTAGRYTLKLSYIATQMNWSANYVARIAPDGNSLALTGWITLANFTDTGFSDVPAQVIAGHPNSGEDRAPNIPVLRTAQKCWPLAVWWRPVVAAVAQQEMKYEGAVETVVVTGSRVPQVGMYSSSPVTAIAAEDFGDYKLYALPERTTIAARQTKQVQFLDQQSVKFERVYAYSVPLYDDGEEPVTEPATVRYRMENRDDTGLGKPLPSGAMSVIAFDGRGAPVFVGENSLDDTPVGGPIAIDTGNAMDVTVERRVLAKEAVFKGTAKERRRLSFEIAIDNRKTVPAKFELSQILDREGETVFDEDRPHVMDHGYAQWHMNLAPGERALVHYKVEYPW